MSPDPLPHNENEFPGIEEFKIPENAYEFPTCRRAADLIREKRKLKLRMEAVEEELDGLRPLIANYLAQIGVPRTTIDGVTLFIRRDLWVRAKNKGQEEMARVCAAMRSTGYGHFVHETFNASEFSSHVRELERLNLRRIDAGEIPDVSACLPPDLAKLLNVAPSYNLMGVIKTNSPEKE